MSGYWAIWAGKPRFEASQPKENWKWFFKRWFWWFAGWVRAGAVPWHMFRTPLFWAWGALYPKIPAINEIDKDAHLPRAVAKVAANVDLESKNIQPLLLADQWQSRCHGRQKISKWKWRRQKWRQLIQQNPCSTKDGSFPRQWKWKLDNDSVDNKEEDEECDWQQLRRSARTWKKYNSHCTMTNTLSSWYWILWTKFCLHFVITWYTLKARFKKFWQKI